MDVITGEFRDMASCNAMSLSKSGWLAFIAGRRGFGLVDLDRPRELLKKFPRKSKYEVTEIQFSSGKETQIAVASNDKIELFDFKEGGELVNEGILRGHTRTITDISWHRQKTHLLASGSIDNFIYIWDLKDFRTPVMSLAAVTGASQVCWERTSGQYLATAHEGEIKLWDIRKGNTPVIYITAHIGKIYSIDFSPYRPDKLVSSSADLSVKMWNVATPKQSEYSFKVPKAPVWKVRYTPFGEGLVTLAHTNAMTRRENNLELWTTHNLMSPVHTFYGHSDLVVEFGWRNIDSYKQRNEYQLVTWSRDSTMKVWPIGGNLKNMGVDDENNLQDNELELRGKLFEGDAGDPEVDDRPLSNTSSEGDDSGFASGSRREPITSSNSMEFDSKSGAPTPDLDGMSMTLPDEEETYIASNPDDPSSRLTPDGATPTTSLKPQPSNLKQEFRLISFGERLTLGVLDLTERYCVVLAETTNKAIHLNVKFPEDYPNRVAPIFSFMTGTTLEQNRGYHLLEKLRLTAQKQVNKNRRCLEMCFRQFEQDIELIYQEEQEALASSEYVAPPTGTGGFQDSNVPWPRSSGARFCGTGQLVCFGWAYTVKYASIANPVLSSKALKTPRSLSSVTSTAQLVGSTPPQHIPIKRGPRVRFSRTKSRMSSTGSSISEDPKGYGGRTVSESDPRRISETEESRGTVTIYDVLPLWPFSTELAQKYQILGPDKESICRYNASVALEAGHNQISKAWAMAAASCALDSQAYNEDSDLENNQLPWSSHPMGLKILMSLVDHFSNCDIQTAAMLCSVFSYPACPINRATQPILPFPLAKPLVSSQSMAQICLAPPMTARKKNSKSECSMNGDSDVEAVMATIRQIPESHSLEDIPNNQWYPSRRPSTAIRAATCDLKGCHRFALDNRKLVVYDAYIKAYAELLSRLGMLNKSTEVTKCLSGMARIKDPEKKNLGEVDIVLDCPNCKEPIKTQNRLCHKCKKRSTCSLCNLPMRGLASICFHCGHGGHTNHMESWFENNDECPTGCGCPCSQLVAF